MVYCAVLFLIHLYILKKIKPTKFECSLKLMQVEIGPILYTKQHKPIRVKEG